MMLDILVITLIALSTILAYFRGFAKEALDVINWIGAALIALYSFSLLNPVMAGIFGEGLVADLVTGLVLFGVAFVVLTTVTRYLCRSLDVGTVGIVNRGLGLIFGLARGAVLVSVLALPMTRVVDPADEPTWLSEAASRPYLRAGAETLWSLLPESMRDRGLEIEGAVADDTI
ncbi:MAG: CvpA family protein [Pseudomonadota bacterium]